MNRDFAFINFYKDLASAKQSDNPIISTIIYQGFIVLPTNKTICQITNSSFNINFVGGILVELIDNCGNSILDITSNFYYSTFIDSNGIKQIKFEFGNISNDYYSLSLHLKITDLVNDNIFYSNSFLITNQYNEKVVEFVYWSDKKINGISYDIANCKQRIFINNCYEQSTANKRELKQYINSQGINVNYRSITTFQRKYFIEFLDFFTNDRLEILFSHPIIYLNSERVTINDFKVGDRLGDTNISKDNEFTINKSGEVYNWEYQVYEFLSLVSFSPFGVYSAQTFNQISGTFNKPILLGVGTLNVYKDNVLFLTFTQNDISISDNSFSIDVTNLFPDNGNYYINFTSGLFYSGNEIYTAITNSTDWSFSIIDGEYDDLEYDENDYLT